MSVAGGVRPSSATLREALSSRWLPRLEGASVLDLYAGTGAVSLELLGRGAARVAAVESRRRVADRLRRCLQDWGVQGLELHHGRLPKALDDLRGPFDLVFADPPYALLPDADAIDRLLAAVAPLLARDGEAALEIAADVEAPEQCGDLRLTSRRRYGDSALAIYRLPAACH